MADFDELRPEVQQFLHDRASALDHDAAPVAAPEAEQRVVIHSLEPSRRWRRTPAAIAINARRQPVLAAAVIAALLVGSVGGFAAGRGSAPSRATVAARGSTQDKSTSSTMVSNGSVGFATAGAGFGGGEMKKLFARTTADGVTVRGYLQTNSGPVPQPMCPTNQWCPPAECNPTSFFNAEVSNNDAVSMGGNPVFPLDAAADNRGEVPLGQMEGSPASVFMVQTNDQVTNVRATWSDGAVDEMAPVDGWALVAHQGAASSSSIVAALKDGSTLELNSRANNSYPVSCQPPPPPPPELPPAGSEQPADVAASKQGVTDAYKYVFTAGNDTTKNGDYIEDVESVKSAADTTKSNFPEASATVSVEVGEVRFLSANEAALYFELKYDGGALFGQQIGYAKLIDGHWKIERDTMCMVLGWGGGQCDPPPDPARSTSAGSAPQPGTYNGPNGGVSSSSSAAGTIPPSAN